MHVNLLTDLGVSGGEPCEKLCLWCPLFFLLATFILDLRCEDAYRFLELTFYLISYANF